VLISGFIDDTIEIFASMQRADFWASFSPTSHLVIITLCFLRTNIRLLLMTSSNEERSKFSAGWQEKLLSYTILDHLEMFSVNKVLVALLE
jgi:hypothetical protein